MRKALVVGIDYYENFNALYGCVNDAHEVKTVLERHSDGSVNFGCKLLAASSSRDQVNRAELKDRIEDLFSGEAEIALLYFSGHGAIESTGGYLSTSDSKRTDDGVSLAEILSLANSSHVTNKVIILDSCNSGIAGTQSTGGELAALSEGLTILTASTKDQYATEIDGRGLFTSLLVDALSGSAANLTGDITPGSVYAHIDQSLGPWEQRPVFKTNVKQFVTLRRVTPPISLSELHYLAEYFPEPGFEFELDPSFEPESKGRDAGMPDPIEENTKKFVILQKYSHLNLLIPVNAKHMWNAAMESKSCKLTALGEHYRRLVVKGRI
jgi:hypothetical protein